MSELNNALEKVVAVGVGSSVITSAALLLTKVDQDYLTNTLTNNVFSLGGYGMLGSVLGAWTWYNYRNSSD